METAKYLNTTQVMEILGCGRNGAIDFMRKMPYLQVGRGRGATIRVKESDFYAFIEANTHQPGVARRRETPFISEKQQQDAKLREWNRQRRATRKENEHGTFQ